MNKCKRGSDSQRKLAGIVSNQIFCNIPHMDKCKFMEDQTECKYFKSLEDVNDGKLRTQVPSNKSLRR
jgi:hypothetical protein